jgi:hypothetical protein
VVPSVDSDEAVLLELLEEDLEDFFFGVPVIVETGEENAKRKTASIRTIKLTIQRNNQVVQQ